MDIPYLGTLIIQNGVACVKFLESIVENVRDSVTQNLKQRERKASAPSFFENSNSNFFASTASGSGFLLESPRPLFANEGALKYLKNELDIDVHCLTRCKAFLIKSG